MRIQDVVHEGPCSLLAVYSFVSLNREGQHVGSQVTHVHVASVVGLVVSVEERHKDVDGIELSFIVMTPLAGAEMTDSLTAVLKDSIDEDQGKVD